MVQLRKMLRRHGLAIGLTVALAAMVWGAALPAIEERAQARSERQDAERALESQTQDLDRAELWLSGLEAGDEQVAARLNQALQRSPDLEGPVIVEFDAEPGPELPGEFGLLPAASSDTADRR
ncbi:MAG: hypothetical protein ACI9EF_000760 [Pseudohongiellaceae bacterium]|jgi:hypothetical protein